LNDSISPSSTSEETPQRAFSNTSWRWNYLAIALCMLAVGCTLITAIAQRESLGAWQWWLYVAAVLNGLAIFWFRRRLSAAEYDLERREQECRQRALSVVNDTQSLQEARTEFEQEIVAESQRLHTQQQAFSRRLATYHEWQEFPLPMDLSNVASDENDNATIADLLKQDQQLQALLQQETEILFDRIRKNEYALEGKFQLPKLRDDLLQLMVRCARIYQPHVEQPLLETSLERVLRAIARIALQWQVVLENLPLDIKRRNLNSLYNYVRQAVLAYGTYQIVRPYWSYANHAWYLGRLAFGANPVALGTWWLLSRLGTKGAQALAERMIQRQSLTLLQDMVRVVGYEVADMYGGDFRHRDANWLYGAELTDLVARFPVSRDSLRFALREISTLALRSEYDRSYLIRSLSSGQSAHPEQYATEQLLSMGERRNLAQRLEKFLTLHVHGKTPERVQAWLKGAEARLGVKLSVEGTTHGVNEQAQLKSSVLSLAGYLSSMKQLEGDAILLYLQNTASWHALLPEMREALLQTLERQPPLFFEEPDLDPQGEAIVKFFQDFLKAAADFPPRSLLAGELIRDMALYLKYPTTKLADQWRAELWKHMQHRCSPSSGVKSLTAEEQATLLDLLDQESLSFFYRSAIVEPPLPNNAPLRLMGTPTRAMLFSLDVAEVKIWWTGNNSIVCELQRNVMTRDCLVRGGEWCLEDEEIRFIRISGPLLQMSESYFQPLLQWKRSQANAQVSP
jgi:hypothetical protein